MLKNKYGNEQVFVIPYMLTTDIPDLFTAGNISNKNLRTFEGKGHFVFRCDAEYNNSVQQIIPYIAVLSADSCKHYLCAKIWLYGVRMGRIRRIRNGNDTQLFRGTEILSNQI